MALVADYRVEAVTDDGTETTIKDYTVFGAPNADRADIAVLLSAFKTDEDQVETGMTSTPDDPDPYVAANWTITNTIDGWVKYYIALIPKWAIGTTYNQYDVVYDGGTVYQYINVTPSAGNATSDINYWSPVTTTDTAKVVVSMVGTASEPGNLTYQLLQVIHKWNAQKCYVRLAAKLAKDRCIEEYPVTSKKSVYFAAFTKLDALLNVSYIDEIQGLYIAGERAMRLAEKYCDDCGCGSLSN